MAALLAMGAACLLLADLDRATGSTAAAERPVVVTARDLPAGARIREDDVTVARLPAAEVPEGALRRVDRARERTLAGPVRRGEPLTDLRFLGPALLAAQDRDGGGPRLVAAPVRIADAASVRLLRPGDRIDVLAAPDGLAIPHGEAVGETEESPNGGSPAARVVASGVRILAVPARPERDTPAEGALVVLAVPRPVAAVLAGASAASGRLAVALR